jgi:hypothetical protein
MTRTPAQPVSTGPARAGFGRSRGILRFLAPGTALLVAHAIPAEAWAAEDPEFAVVPSTPEAPQWTVDARVGPALLLRSQSHALRHVLKPDLRLGARIGYRERWEFGAAVDALVDGSEHYRVLGLMGQARFAVLQAAAFSLGVSAALGAGYDADILHSSLQADGRVAPYYFAALDGRWRVSRWLVGVEAGYQNAAILQGGLLLGYVFPQ